MLWPTNILTILSKFVALSLDRFQNFKGRGKLRRASKLLEDYRDNFFQVRLVCVGLTTFGIKRLWYDLVDVYKKCGKGLRNFVCKEYN